MDLVERFIHKYGRLPTEFDKDYLEMLRMSKYRILAVPDLKPGKCANCGSAKNDGRKYIDFGLEVDFYGIVYICGECLKDIAMQMGLFTKWIEEIAQLRDSLLQLREASAKGIEIRDDFLKIFKEVQDYITSLPVASDDINPSSDDRVDKPKANETTITVDTIKSAANAAKSRITKSSTSSRSQNIPSLAELLNATDE